MSKWRKLKHRIQLGIAYRWFLSLKSDLNRLGIGNPSVVFDVGAHHGQTTLHFTKSFPTASIHCFEPVDENFIKLKANTKDRKLIQVNKFALGSAQTSVMIKTGQSDQTHQVLRKKEKSNANEEIRLVRMDTIDNYMKDRDIFNIDLLKIDVEGYELEVLSGAKDALQSSMVKTILAECDFDPDDTQHTYFNDLWDFLRKKNYAFIGLYDVIHYSNTSGIGYCNALFRAKKIK